MGCKKSAGTDEIGDFVADFEQFALSPRFGKQYQVVKCHTNSPFMMPKQDPLGDGRRYYSTLYRLRELLYKKMQLVTAPFKTRN